jgi:transposase-like protein
MPKHMRSDVELTYIPSGRPGDACRRRSFGKSDKRRIVEEASRPGQPCRASRRSTGSALGFCSSGKRI